MALNIVTPGTSVPLASSAPFTTPPPFPPLSTVVGLLNADASSVTPAFPAPVLPRVGSIVTARVHKISSRSAHAHVLIVDGVPARPGAGFRGTIRKEDVRASETDRVEIPRCFRPGDVVQCEVVGMGDRWSWFLGTARNELGVVWARARESGEVLVPVSWCEMACPVTGRREERKVAKRG